MKHAFLIVMLLLGSIASASEAVSSYIGTYHPIIAIAPKGDHVTLENESQWEFEPQAWGSVREWRNDDLLLITPNTSWFAWSEPTYIYCLKNDRTQEIFPVNNSVPPPLHNSNLLFITQMTSSLIKLKDNSTWRIKKADRQKMMSWQVGDILMVGSNNTWFMDSIPNILINMTNLDHVRAEYLQQFP